MKIKNLLPLLALLCLPGIALAQDKAAPAPPVAKSKKMPARDPKTGKFLKKSADKMGATTKKMPARDPKTGRFIKKSADTKPTTKMTGKMSGMKMNGKARKMPARDPKTGRFIKSSDKK